MKFFLKNIANLLAFSSISILQSIIKNLQLSVARAAPRGISAWSRGQAYRRKAGSLNVVLLLNGGGRGKTVHSYDLEEQKE